MAGKLTLTFAAIALGATACTASPRMTLSAAVDVCTERARDFALIPRGPLGEEPEPWQVEQRYRACVYANSGSYPSEPPRYRDSVLTLLQDALK